MSRHAIESSADPEVGGGDDETQRVRRDGRRRVGRRPFSELMKPIMDDPVRRARVEEIGRAMDDVAALAKLREERGLTQQDVADALQTSQPNISQIEHREDLYLSTLREYVEDMGGELEVRAVFPDQVVVLIAARGAPAPDGDGDQPAPSPSPDAARQPQNPTKERRWSTVWERTDASFAEHQRIIDAIRLRDGRVAEQAAYDHIMPNQRAVIGTLIASPGLRFINLLGV